MKMFNFKKLLSFFIVLILSCGVLCFAGCKTETISTNSADLKSSNFELSSMHENGISLTRKKAIVIKDNNGNYLQETLTANIMADVGNDKTLVWSAKWVDSSVTANLSEYLKVEPLQAGGNVANVKCYKNFEEFGSIVITASSKVAPNVMASCMVNYVGKPTDIELLDENNVPVDGTIQLDLNSSYTFKINQIHPIEVGSFYEDYDVTFELAGDVLINYIGNLFEGDIVVTPINTFFDLPIDKYLELPDFDDYYKENKAMFDMDYAGTEFRNVDKFSAGELTDGPLILYFFNCAHAVKLNTYLEYSISESGVITINTKDPIGSLMSCTLITSDYSKHHQYKIAGLDGLDIVMKVKNKNSNLLSVSVFEFNY